jgi:outer membrane protein, heavy metal efflux system
MRNVFLFLLLISPAALRADSSCAAFSTAQDVLACVLANHPDILRLQAEAANLDAFEALAMQRPNPEVDSEFVSPNEDTEPALRLQAAYLHTFELGGKRGGRVHRAKAERELLQASLDRRKQDLAIQTVRNLYRLRHIQAELRTVDEGLETFSKIAKQYKARKQLTPEQQVSLDVFLLAEGDYMLRKSGLLQEQMSLERFFTLTTGANFTAILKTLPPKKEKWPEVTPQPTQGPEWREAQAALQMSQSELKLARSDAWPDMRLGPLVEMESGRGYSSQALGASLSLPLPLYSRNRGAKLLAVNKAKLAEIHLQADFKTWQRVYENAVDSLKNIPTVRQMEKKHESMESFFERGLISSSLLIEAHRQMADFTKSLNEQELRAVEALWTIYSLQGRVLQEAL